MTFHTSPQWLLMNGVWVFLRMSCPNELDAVGRQFEPYLRVGPTLTSRLQMHLHAGGALVVWPGMLFPNSRVITAAANPRLILDSAVTLIKIIDSQAWQGQCEAVSPTVCCLHSELVSSIHYKYMSCLADSGKRETNVLIPWTLCPLQWGRAAQLIIRLSISNHGRGPWTVESSIYQETKVLPGVRATIKQSQLWRSCFGSPMRGFCSCQP